MNFNHWIDKRKNSPLQYGRRLKVTRFKWPRRSQSSYQVNSFILPFLPFFFISWQSKQMWWVFFFLLECDAIENSVFIFWDAIFIQHWLGRKTSSDSPFPPPHFQEKRQKRPRLPNRQPKSGLQRQRAPSCGTIAWSCVISTSRQPRAISACCSDDMDVWAMWRCRRRPMGRCEALGSCRCRRGRRWKLLLLLPTALCSRVDQSQSTRPWGRRSTTHLSEKLSKKKMSSIERGEGWKMEGSCFFFCQFLYYFCRSVLKLLGCFLFFFPYS